ncbi:MAG TPA: hypothetical protein VG934_03505 [Candidatus Paceibacterota bacterium]|nr:hypothetical protein [Candidatus Paceibacterota bacterium]
MPKVSYLRVVHDAPRDDALKKIAREILACDYHEGVPAYLLGTFQSAFKASSWSTIFTSDAAARLASAPGSSIEFHDAWSDLTALCHAIVSVA